MSKKDLVTSRRGKVGGQAVLEGVMMKSGDNVSLSVRREDGTIETANSKFITVRKKSALLRLPIIRGMVNFIEMMILSFKTLGDSAEMLGIEEEETKFEKWLKKRFGKSILDILMPISIALGVGLAIFLFIFLPMFLTKMLQYLTGDLGWVKNVIEGILKIAIFVGYLLAVSKIPEIRRTFEYHGAEHKSIYCYEYGEELTVENVKKQIRFHPRCGTSLIFVMLIIGIIAGTFVGWNNIFLRTLTKLLIFPLIVGVGYEFLMFSGKHDGIIMKILTAPGLWMQRITTKEPDACQIEVAIASLKGAMPDVFPPVKPESDVSDVEIPDKKNDVN